VDTIKNFKDYAPGDDLKDVGIFLTLTLHLVRADSGIEEAEQPEIHA
jgi:hypothetical protein